MESTDSPRSAREYGVAANGAVPAETPDSLSLAPGALPHDRLLETLGTGLFVSNLWYLNYSDRQACRMTGMTRFACFWVEAGQLVAPLDVMRFDDSFLRMFGDGLVGLTDRAETLPEAGTYQSRQLSSITTPTQQKRLYIDPRMLPLLQGRRVALIDDVISSGAGNIESERDQLFIRDDPVRKHKPRDRRLRKDIVGIEIHDVKFISLRPVSHDQ